MTSFFAVHDLSFAGILIGFVFLLAFLLYATVRVHEGMKFKWTNGTTSPTASHALRASAGAFLLMLFSAMPAGEFLASAEPFERFRWMGASAALVGGVMIGCVIFESFMLLNKKGRSP